MSSRAVLHMYEAASKFWGTTENAVRIQIYCAIIAYCLIATVQKNMQLERSTSEVLEIIIDKTKSQNVKALFKLNDPNLCDC